MTRTPMLDAAEIRRSCRAPMRAKARPTAEAHSRYEPGRSDADTDYGARNPRFN